MPLLFLPSPLSTVDIHLEEQVAPMEDGALILPRLDVASMFERPAPRLDLSLDGLPATLLPFPGRTRYAWAWFPYGLYDVAVMLDGFMIEICLDIAGVVDMCPIVLALPRLAGAPHHANHYEDAPPPYVHDSPFLSKGLSA